MAEECAGKETGIVRMLEQRNKEDLKLLHEVFKRDKTTYRYIVDQLSPYLASRGENIVRDEENLKDPNTFAIRLLELKAEVDDLVKYSFDDTMLFQKTRDQAFTQFMNEQAMVPSYIASHVHENLTQGFKGLSDDIVGGKLESIIDIFRLLHGRDAFIKQAENLLAYRLLNKISISNQYEELLL